MSSSLPPHHLFGATFLENIGSSAAEDFGCEPDKTNEERSLLGCSYSGCESNSTMRYHEASTRNLSLNDVLTKRTKKRQDDALLLMTDGFDKLSVADRERALTVLHGVSDAVDESPSLVEQSLNDLSLSLAQRKCDNRAAYDKAAFLNPGYVENTDFRLMFLRCERYDVYNATTRIFKHFETKLELFGEECLGRDITFDDLDEDSAEIYSSAAHWYLDGVYDRAGRRIFFVAVERVWFKKAINRLRMGWYNTMNALKDVKTQINGGTMVIFSVGETIRRPLDVQSILQTQKMMKSLPMYWAGIHFCYEDKVAAQVYPNPITLVQMAFDTITRMRFRIHHGSVVEMKYALLSYGIPSFALPVDANGFLVDDEFKRKVSKERASEELYRQRLASSNVIDCPKNLDVLLGRGRPYQEFAGNIRLNQMVETRRLAYETKPKSGKTREVLKIAEAIYMSGGRFLRRTSSLLDDQQQGQEGGGSAAAGDSSCPLKTKSGKTSSGTIGNSGTTSTMFWEEVDFATARKKVSNCFHTQRRLKGNPMVLAEQNFQLD